MANVCYCHLDVTGASVNRLRKMIKTKSKKLDKIFTWLLPGPHYGLIQDIIEEIPDEGDLNLEFTCKWRPPLDELVDLSIEFPDCTFDLRYEESGMDIYGTVSYSKGEQTQSTEMDKETFLSNFDEDFAEALNKIEDSPYEEFLTLLEDIEPQQGDYLLEAHYLKRLKDEDLPLFINHEWLNSYNRDLYLKRLKGE